MSHTVEFTFTKTIFIEDAKSESDAQDQATAHLLNLLNQVEDNLSLIEKWMKIKIIKLGE